MDELSDEELALARAAMRQAAREYRKNNKEKYRASVARYWVKKARKMQERGELVGA